MEEKFVDILLNECEFILHKLLKYNTAYRFLSKNSRFYRIFTFHIFNMPILTMLIKFSLFLILKIKKIVGFFHLSTRVIGMIAH